ncbi:MAG: MerC domain-containing protein, partial [Gammaproteobacteria bacterium]|nr:MerC domain-containing protein [Gammaproteobacteria bacterium]
MKVLLESTEVPRKLDKLAILLSGTCLVHCLALPLLVTLVPISQGSLLEEQTFHLLMLWIILPTSLLALTSGCWKHK